MLLRWSLLPRGWIFAWFPMATGAVVMLAMYGGFSTPPGFTAVVTDLPQSCDPQGSYQIVPYTQRTGLSVGCNRAPGDLADRYAYACPESRPTVCCATDDPASCACAPQRSGSRCYQWMPLPEADIDEYADCGSSFTGD